MFPVFVFAGCLVTCIVALTSPPTEWQVVGPFAWGMRELGGDPLEAFGGIVNLPFPFVGTFPSELADFGQIKPATFKTDSDGSVSISFPEVRWEFNRQFQGWTANQWQAWASGQFVVSAEEAGVYAARCSSVGEFIIDNKYYHGDWYGYGELWSRVELDVGIHMWHARLASEMRLFGGQLPPTVRFQCELINMSSQVAHILTNQAIYPEVSSSTAQLISPYIGIGIFNPTSGYITIANARSNSSDFDVSLLTVSGVAVRIASGQSRRIALQLTSRNTISCPATVSLLLDVIDVNGAIRAVSLSPTTLVCRSASDAFKLTFLDQDNSVQYTMARAPKSSCPSSSGCPVLVSLHGAGVEASSGAWTSAYAQQQYSWVIQPTGKTSWGYDWHGASRINVERAIATVQSFAGDGQIDSSRILLTGHSNGGQGCWYWASHYPDTLVAANPASGYLKIQLYVPFYWRPGDSHADPILRALLESSIAEFDNDLYAENLVGLPLIARTGGDDDNVPPIHSRRMVRLLNELNADANNPTLSEVEGRGHYYDGIMTDGEIGPFIERYTQVDVALPAFPSSFTVVTLNPASSSSRGNIAIWQLDISFRLGRVNVEIVVEGSEVTWFLRTENVRRFAVLADARFTATQLVVDDVNLPIRLGPSDHYCRLDSTWQICTEADGWRSLERSPSSSGPVLQVYDRAIAIVVGTHGTTDEIAVANSSALTIANDWLHFGNGNVEIIPDSIALTRNDLDQFNLILIGGPSVNSFTASIQQTLPVKFESNGQHWRIEDKLFNTAATGVLFTSPWKDNLAVIASGSDSLGLRYAISQFPVRTGTTVPDYIVVNEKQAWKAAGGVLAAGFWTFDWKFSLISGYIR